MDRATIDECHLSLNKEMSRNTFSDFKWHLIINMIIIYLFNRNVLHKNNYFDLIKNVSLLSFTNYFRRNKVCLFSINLSNSDLTKMRFKRKELFLFYLDYII